MTSTAHSDFFSLDLGAGNAPSYSLPDDVLDRAEATLQKWALVAPRSDAQAASSVLHRDEALPNATGSVESGAASTNAVSSTLDILPEVTPGPSKKRSSPSSSHSSSLPDARNKVQKTFHFVADSDKKTAARIRNTMTSRNLRQSKVSRITELERELERQQAEAEEWRRRAVEAGWKEKGV